METRNSCFQATFHQENTGKLWQPSPLVFIDRRGLNLVGGWRSDAKYMYLIGHWFLWQQYWSRVNRKKRSHPSHLGLRLLKFNMYGQLSHINHPAKNESNLPHGLKGLICWP